MHPTKLILATIFLFSIAYYTGAQTTQPAGTPQSGTPQSGTPEQRMDRLLAAPSGSGEPLAPKPAGPTIDASTGKAAVAPGAPALQVVREGTHKINISGRLNHSTDGQQAIFTFDTDGKTMADPPMIILPNLKLQSMEAAVAGRASDVHFRVSGTVTEYKGRNYILLDKAVVMADVEQQF